MPNRSQEENDRIVISALRESGEKGLTVDELRIVLFGKNTASNSLVKKMLDRLRAKGHICQKMGRMGLYYVLPPGH